MWFEHRPLGLVDDSHRYLVAIFSGQRECLTGVVRIVIRAELIASFLIERKGQLL